MHKNKATQKTRVALFYRYSILSFVKLCELGKAALTNFATVEVHEIVFFSTEKARIVALRENYFVSFNIDLKKVFCVDAKVFADLHGDNHSAKNINGSCNTCGFHFVTPLVVLGYRLGTVASPRLCHYIEKDVGCQQEMTNFVENDENIVVFYAFS